MVATVSGQTGPFQGMAVSGEGRTNQVNYRKLVLERIYG